MQLNFAPNFSRAARKAPMRAAASSEPQKKPQGVRANKPKAARSRAANATYFSTTPQAVEALPFKLDPFTKHSADEYKELDIETAAAFIVQLQDQLESTWLSFAAERRNGAQLSEKLTTLESKISRTSAALKQASHNLVVLGGQPVEVSSKADTYWC